MRVLFNKSVKSKIAQTLYNDRSHQKSKKQCGITKLDRLVMQAYGFHPDDDLLKDLLMFNLELAEKEKRGEAIVGPWAPQ